MRITLAKPYNHMSPGELFYSQPTEETESEVFDALCSIRVEADKQMQEHLSAELDAIKNTDNATNAMMVYEISELSKELGYPVALSGRENGLYTMELLGVSNAGIKDYDKYKMLSSDLCIADMLRDRPHEFELMIAEPVRSHIQHRMDHLYGHLKCNGKFYRRICLPRWLALEYVGKLSEITGFDYNEIPLDDINLLQLTADRICADNLGWADYSETVSKPVDVARLYAFTRCDLSFDKTPDEYHKVKDYVFCEDVFGLLVNCGTDAREAYRLSLNWAKEKELPDRIKSMKSVPDSFYYAYEHLGFQWSVSSCFARTQVLLMLSFYKHNYPNEYLNTVEELS